MGRGANLPKARLEYNRNPLLLNEWLPDYVLKKTKYVVVPSVFLKSVIKEQFGVSAIVLESPFVLDGLKWDYQCYDDMIRGKRYVLHHGSLKYLKGTHIVAGLAERLLQEYPDLYIVLAGNSEEMFDAVWNNFILSCRMQNCVCCPLR